MRRKIFEDLAPVQIDEVEKGQVGFRNYEAEGLSGVESFYQLNHRYQCVEFMETCQQRFVTERDQTKSHGLVRDAYLPRYRR
ncbi:MAG: hypothetical protein ACI8Z1_001134 [Candidatus Azotimanducaceae bacterium]|jgi:hypothetical protein